MDHARASTVPSDRFLRAAAAVAAVGDGGESELADVLLRFLPVDGAAVSTMGDTLVSETVSATDALAARLDEVQFDVGEGPCWDALARRRPVLQPNFADARTLWPGFAETIGEGEVGAVFAFPLTVGPLEVGAIDLYTRGKGALSELEVTQTTLIAALVSRVVLRRVLLHDEDDSQAEETEFSRRLVHQATGVTVAQLRLTPDDALLVIQGRAFATGQSLMSVSQQIVEGKLRFTASTNGIEDHQ
jgi:hypothetical protein